MMNILIRVQSILSLDADKEAQLNEIIQIQYESLSSLLNTTTVPAQLEYIVVETSIARYNRLGSEGLKSEGIDVIAQNFIENLFEPYQAQIQSYIYNNPTNSKPKKLKLLWFYEIW